MPSLPLDNHSELISRLRADQSERWNRGERIQVEEYLAQYPDLVSDPEAVLDLIVAEALLREEKGDTPVLDEYIARFPAYANFLQRIWKLPRVLHHGLAPMPDTGGSEALTLPANRQVAWKTLPPIPGYEILARLGQGGMGVVFKARQLDLDRLVAIKLISRGPLAGEEEIARFRTEAKAVARLHHPGVVQIHTFGETEGWLYLVMEYVPGGSLSSRLKRGVLPVREAATLVRDLARAIQAAHEAQILHRDLKPGNVLLDEAGQAKVSDFGLARLLDIETDLTRSEIILGTPAYMAPEQAHGLTHAIGSLADVYALGVIFYECLVGQPPFRGATRAETLELVKSAEPDRLRLYRPDVPADLEAVCLKCLEKASTDRHASAAELADELDRWLSGEPVRTQQPGSVRRWSRWLRRRPLLVGSTCLAILLVALGVGWHRAQDTEAPLRQIQRNLANEDAVTLVEEQSTPRWSKWVLNQAINYRARDGSFAIETWTTSLLELVADPQRTRYRLRARIRHDQSKNGTVGLYVGREEFWVGDKKGQFFFQANFNDIDNEGDRILEGLRKVPGARLPAQHPLNRVIFRGTTYIPQQARNAGLGTFGLFEKRLFAPSKPGNPTWRPLAVEVRPDQIRLFWDNQEVGTFETAEIARRASQSWKTLIDRQPELANGQFPGRFNPRGGLGMVLRNSSASYEDVVIEPLSD